MPHKDKFAVTDHDKVILMNKYFESVFSSKNSFDTGYMEIFKKSCLVDILQTLNTTTAVFELGSS